MPPITPSPGRFNLQNFVLQHFSDAQEESYNGGRKYLLKVCPFNTDHNDGSAVICELSNGAISFKCHHNGCANHKWQDVRRKFEPGCYDWHPGSDDRHVDLAAIRNPPQSAVLAPGVVDVAEYQLQVELASGIIDKVRAKLPAEDIAGFIANYSESRREFLHGEGPKTIEELMSKYQEQRPPIIHGLLREGETMNIIAAPKMGKSWLVYDLGLSVATGGKWLGEYQTVQGDVLLIDNELYPESLATRIPKVADALGLKQKDYSKSFVIEPLRGRLKDIASLNGYFARFEPGRFKLVIIDAWYRALPKETDENANGDMTSLYNLIDCYSQRLGCAFVLIHHASKGNQSGKSVTDVGSGAGAQSRAADTHLILRPHEENDVVVLDAAVRSWPSVQPTCLRWHFPAWELAPELDPALLRRERPRRSADKNKDVAPKEPEWTPERFAGQFAGEAGQVKLAIIDAAIKAGLSDRKATDLFKRAVAIDLLYEHPGKQFSTTRYIATDGDSPTPQATFFKRDAVVAAIDANPDMSNREIAKLAGVDHSYVGRIRKELIK